VFEKYWGFLVICLAYILAITVLTSVFHAEPLAVVAEPPKKLLCFDVASKILRTSDTNLLCNPNEESLGTTPIQHSISRPTSINRTFEVRFLAAQAAGEKLGYKLRITSGFRSQTLQAKLFADAVRKYGSEEEASKWVLPEDISNHPWGTAIDVNYPGDKIAVKWLEDNGSIFGLCRVYENEWWHFEPIIAPGDLCPQMATNALVTLQNMATGAETNS